MFPHKVMYKCVVPIAFLFSPLNCKNQTSHNWRMGESWQSWKRWPLESLSILTFPSPPRPLSTPTTRREKIGEKEESYLHDRCALVGLEWIAATNDDADTPSLASSQNPKPSRNPTRWKHNKAAQLNSKKEYKARNTVNNKKKMDFFCPRKSQSHSGNLFASLPLPLLIFKSCALLVRSFHCFFKVIPAFTIWVFFFFFLSSFSLCCVSYPYVGSAPTTIVSGAVQCTWVHMHRAALDAVVQSCGREFCV